MGRGGPRILGCHCALPSCSREQSCGRHRVTGQVVHDAFIGDAAAQDAHEKEMREGHGEHGKEANAVSVKPGKSASLTHTFDKAGQLLIGCHEPGHYDGGMVGRIAVRP